jgi:hypothetical protein
MKTETPIETLSSYLRRIALPEGKSYCLESADRLEYLNRQNSEMMAFIRAQHEAALAMVPPRSALTFVDPVQYLSAYIRELTGVLAEIKAISDAERDDNTCNRDPMAALESIYQKASTKNVPESTELVVDLGAKERNFFLNHNESGFGDMANTEKSILEYIDAELGNMDDGDEATFIVRRKDMTKAELEALPEP